MDLTELLMLLKSVTGMEVYQDICTDEEADMYITYIYQDERPVLCADNEVQADRCDIYVNLYTPLGYDYFATKKKIKEFLEGNEFIITSVSTGIEVFEEKKIRRTTFDCGYAAFRE